MRPASRHSFFLACAVVWMVLVHVARAGDKNGVGLEKISLPSGPGSIEGLGDAFQPQLNTGTSSYSVKIAGPPGVAGFQPDVTLRYNAGGGNGHFGMAWSDGLKSIQRQTEKGLPTYGASDHFTMGGEELVPLADGSYRLKNEGEFQRITRQGSGWVVFDKNGTRWFLGSQKLADNPSRIVRPGGSEAFDDTFKWFVDTAIDVHGNRMEYHYQYMADSPGDTYCVEIRYSVFGSSFQAIDFDYEPRPDAFENYLGGFQVRVGERCYRVRVSSSGASVRSYALAYSLPANDPVEVIAPNDVGLTFSLLREVRQFDNAGTTGGNYLPPLRFGYTRFDAANVGRGGFPSPSPYSLGNPNLALADINCDGLPDFFYTDPRTTAHSVIYNLGGGRFSPEYSFVNSPLGVTLDSSDVQLMDLDGDGRVDLVVDTGGGYPATSYYPNLTRPVGNDDTRPAWGDAQDFKSPYLPFHLNDPTVRSLDLNGDRRMDFMRTTPAGFVYYYNRGDHWEEDGIYLFGEPQTGDITYADAVSFDDGQGHPNVNVKLADMNGDRLLDLVRLYVFENQLQVVYWPNEGRGYWGTRHPMGGTIDLGVVPLEDVFLMDVNGDGLADVVAVAVDHVSYWVNLGNGTFSQRFEVSGTATYIKGQTVLRQADINGNGSTDLVWENWDPATGGWHIDYVDFTGAVKPNLLAVIDNGIGLRTDIAYKTSTDFYTAAASSAHPWSSRPPFAVQVVSKITKRFGLDLDAIPGIDSYVTEFAYRDGYYDPFMKEFRGFGFARKIERGDDRTTDGGPAAEINSPSTVTRLAFHTGAPDGIDHYGNGTVDAFDTINGWITEPLKGKLLWSETALLTAQDDADGGAFDPSPDADALVFSRDVHSWALRKIHDANGGFDLQPFPTMDGRRVVYAFEQANDHEIIEGPNLAGSGSLFGSGASPATVRTHFDVDFFGNSTRKEEYGVVNGGGALGGSGPTRFTLTQYAYNVGGWIVGLPAEVNVTDGPGGGFVADTRNYYDGTALGAVGDRGLLTSSEKFIAGGNSVVTRMTYDAYGNPVSVQDPDYGNGSGHSREYGYDATYHTFVETETVHTGSVDLTATAAYHKGAGVITASTDFNGNTSTYSYDSFYRLVGVVKPGDSAGSPTLAYDYQPGDPWRSLLYTYSPAGALSLAVAPAGTITSAVSVHARTAPGGGTFDTVQITDGAGHKLGTLEEGESPGQWVCKNVKRYTSRGVERDTYLPFYGGSSPVFTNPPSDGARVTDYYDAVGRKTLSLNPPENAGNPARTGNRTAYLPLKSVLFDEEQSNPASPHANTPHVQYQDGLGRLVGVDENNREGGGGAATYATRYRYDLNDQLTSITDSQGNLKTMAYDGLKRLTFMSDPDRGTMNYTYDAASNLLQTIDAKSQVIVMSYDGANRLLTEDYRDAANRTPDIAYFYDVPAGTIPAGDGTSVSALNTRGKLAFVRDLSGEEHLSYDARGRIAWKVKRIPDPVTGALVSYQNAYAYDSLDRITTLGYPDGDQVSHVYNSRSLLRSITGGPGGSVVSNISYQASGQPAQVTYGNGVVSSYGYDPRLRLSDLATDSPTAGALVHFHYSFDGASNITRIDDGRPVSAVPASDPRRNTQVFSYDDLYRLTGVQYPAVSGQIGYAYDRIGNMLGQTSNITQTDDITGLSVTNLGTMGYGGSTGASGRSGKGGQPGPHALTSAAVGGRAYPYDANGNMTTIDGLACTWDFKDRLTTVENTQMRAEYTYDYADRRITKKVFPKTAGVASTLSRAVLYVDRAFEVREDGAPVKYVWNDDTRIARVSANLNATQRVQRFALKPGWNILALAVTLADGQAQLLQSPVQQVFQQGMTPGSYTAPGQTLPAGTVLRVQASAAGVIAVRGTWTAPAAASYPAGRQWVANRGFTPLDVGTQLPTDAPLWFFDASTQSWLNRFLAPLTAAGNHPAKLQPGEATFAATTTPFVLGVPDPTLDVRYYHQDHLGSSSVMSDANGQLVSESAYYPFGYPRQENQPRGVKESYQFTQKEKDGESGLQYFEARFLTGPMGRFLRVDSLASQLPSQWLQEPQKQNLYAYCVNRPIALIDPSGCDVDNPDSTLNGGSGGYAERATATDKAVKTGGDIAGVAGKTVEMMTSDNNLLGQGLVALGKGASAYTFAQDAARPGAQTTAAHTMASGVGSAGSAGFKLGAEAVTDHACSALASQGCAAGFEIGEAMFPLGGGVPGCAVGYGATALACTAGATYAIDKMGDSIKTSITNTVEPPIQAAKTSVESQLNNSAMQVEMGVTQWIFSGGR